MIDYQWLLKELLSQKLKGFKSSITKSIFRGLMRCPLFLIFLLTSDYSQLHLANVLPSL